MNSKDCKEFKELDMYDETLCKFCISSCKERKRDYDLAGNRWSLKVGGRTKRSTDVELEGDKK